MQLLQSPNQPGGNATGSANKSEDACGAEGGEDEGASGLGIFLIISTLAFVVFFAIGPGSIPWMCVGELFNQVFPFQSQKTIPHLVTLVKGGRGQKGQMQSYLMYVPIRRSFVTLKAKLP